MTLFRLARRYFWARSVPNLLSAASVAVAVSLWVAAHALVGGAKNGLLQPSGAQELVVGAKGSSTQLVLSALFYLDAPPGNISYRVYRRLAADPRAAMAVPISLGDSFRGFRIVGTTHDFFRLRAHSARSQTGLIEAPSGRLFEREFETVIGASVAKEAGLRIGSSFSGIHGLTGSLDVDEGDIRHQQGRYTVVGILRPTGSPIDRGIFTSLGTVWKVHGLRASNAEEPSDQEALALQVTAVLVRARSFMDLMWLRSLLQGSPETQAVIPATVIGRLFEIFGVGEQVLRAIAVMVVAVGAIAIMISLFGATAERRHEIATMRALGARPQTIAILTLLESAMNAASGAVLGLLGGYGSAWLTSVWLTRSVGFSIPISLGVTSSVQMIGAAVLLGVVAGIAPALGACRTEVADNLNPAA